MSLKMQKLTAQDSKALWLPLSATTSRGPGEALPQQSQRPPGGGGPPAPSRQTRSGGCWSPGSMGSCWGLGQARALCLGCPGRGSSAQIQPPALWNLPVWSRPPWRPQGLGGETHPVDKGVQGPRVRTGSNSEAAGTPGPQRKARHRSAGQTGLCGQLPGRARPGAAGPEAAVGRRLPSALGSECGRRGNL